MKAFFSRLHLGGSSSKDKEKDFLKEKFPPLKSWPPEDPKSVPPPSPFKPLPELRRDLVSVSPPPPPMHDDPSTDSATARPSRSESEVTPKPSVKPLNGHTNGPYPEVQKKVAFISPAPTPMMPERAASTEPSSLSPSGPPIKTTLSRFQATHGKEPRGSTTSSVGASSSKTDLVPSTKAANKPASARTTSPYLNKFDPSSQSLRSGTPYSQMSQNTSGSRILAAQSWSEVTEEDLVSHLGARERTRQEVLFEIISSEERYVQELVKMKDTFIDPLLHPFSTATAPPMSSTPNLDYDYYRSESPAESNDLLPPIAARFMSPTPTKASLSPQPDTLARKLETPVIDGESMDSDEDADDQLGRGYPGSRGPGNLSQAAKHSHPRSPYRATVTKIVGKNTAVPFPSRSHHSLPPPPRINPATSSTHSLGRQSTLIEERERERNYSQGHASLAAARTSLPQQRPGMLRKFKKSDANGINLLGDALAPHQLPEDLRICLEVVDNGVFDGHKRLSEALKKRYDDQYPLVRSLADVFVANSDIFHGYATYVLHLERALEQVDAALSNVITKKPKKQDVAEWHKVCKTLQRLEEAAAEKGETGLAITLSKPFQRLLKYPLLFQNLLFHTDPSTFEYESTLQMVAEVETIVRSIEDEKIQKEERDKTRDVFARIEGLEKVKQLALPKPSRVLVEERQCVPGANGSFVMKSSSPPPAMNTRGVRGRSSFKRLSDVLQPGSGKKDLWFVVFNDVVLQCQRTGTTSLPLVSSTTSRATSLPEMQGRSKYATTGRRNSHTKPRNLYKYIKIETWSIGDVVQPREGVVSMEDVVRSRAQAQVQPRIVPMPEDKEDGDDEDGDSDDSDRKSKMSFSYWGADKVTVQKPIIKGRVVATRRGGHGASYGRESSANAKFGTRLVSGDTLAVPRPASRRTQVATPISRKATSDESKSTVTRPEWNTSTRPPIVATPATKRARNTSQTASQASIATRTTAKGPGSPAPSEDSGVGLFRQMLQNGA